MWLTSEAAVFWGLYFMLCVKLFPALCELQRLFCLLLSHGSFLVLAVPSHTYADYYSANDLSGCLYVYLELSLQFAPPQCCVPQNLAVLTSPNYELSPQLIETTRLCCVPLPCPEAWNLSRQWAKDFIGLISFVSFSQESLLCCLLSSVWKLMFHIFFFFGSLVN